ncbi:GntR family transcriptional regulator [Opitutaceae bacterium TAV4]|nr:GntR family transcriptional regulator [Opitutaceae bacterium TAV4]RRK02853.1 GntR family transcriptional regulator [Opitutaceae bacterium TAV3]
MPKNAQNISTDALRDFWRNGNGGIHREIAHYLREKITSGALPSGGKLPSVRELAQLWGTNIFSVKLATDSLVNIGLLNKQQGKGMFVAAQNGEVRRVGIYMSKAPDSFSISDLSFAFALRDLLCARLQRQGIEFVLYDDYRPSEEHLKPPAELQDAIISSRLQCVIGVIVRSYDSNWFDRLPIKKIRMMRDPLIDFDGIATKIKQRNCQRVAMIAPAGIPKREADSFLLTGLKSVGVTIRSDRLRLIEESEISKHGWGEIGYRNAKELLASKRRPDALIVYPDNTVQGAIQAILESGIKVPKDLFVIFHRNVELGYYCNFAADYIDVSISDIADKLIQRISGNGLPH